MPAGSLSYATMPTRQSTSNCPNKRKHGFCDDHWASDVLMYGCSRKNILSPTSKVCSDQWRTANFLMRCWARNCWKITSCIVERSTNHFRSSGWTNSSGDWMPKCVGFCPYITTKMVLSNQSEWKDMLYQNSAWGNHWDHFFGLAWSKLCKKVSKPWLTRSICPFDCWWYTELRLRVVCAILNNCCHRRLVKNFSWSDKLTWGIPCNYCRWRVELSTLM